MLFIAEGSIRDTPPPDELTALQAWIGPMVDAGFMQSGYLDRSRTRVWMVLSSDSLHDAKERLADLPVCRDGSVTFTVTAVSAIRFR